MTPPISCALCGQPVPDLRTAWTSLHGQRVHAGCATRYDLDLAPDLPPPVALPSPCRSLVATLLVSLAWGTVMGILVAGTLGALLGWLWR